MSLLLLLDGIPGIRGAVFTDGQGEVLEARHLLAHEAADVASVALVAAQLLAQMGEGLNLGTCELVVVRSESAARVVIPRRGSVAALELEPKRLLPPIEAKLRALDWAVKASAPPARAAPVASSPPAPVPRASPALPPPVPTSVAASTTKKTGSSGFNGTFHTISVPDLLEYCRNSRRTGLLLCRWGDVTGRVKVVRGQIVDARSPGAKTMTERLVEGGTVTREALRNLGFAYPDEVESGHLARRIADNGLLDREGAERLLFAQVLDVVDELVGWVDGSFEFRPLAESAETTDATLETDPQLVLMQLFKEHDEALQEWGAQVTNGGQT